MPIQHCGRLLLPSPGVRRRCPAVLLLAGMVFETCGLLPELAAQEEAGRFRDAREGFSFVPPSGWQRSKTVSNPQLRHEYFGPLQGNFRANLNVTLDSDAGESFDDVSKQLKEFYPTLLTDWKLAEEGETQIDGKPAYCLTATYRMGLQTLRLTQFVVRGGNGKMIIFTFTTINSQYNRLMPVFARSAMSVKIE